MGSRPARPPCSRRHERARTRRPAVQPRRASAADDRRLPRLTYPFATGCAARNTMERSMATLVPRRLFEQQDQLVERRVPPLAVQVALGRVLEGLVDDRQARAALDLLEADVDKRILATRAVGLQPGPGEGDVAGGLDGLVDARADEGGAADAVHQRRLPGAADPD